MTFKDFLKETATDTGCVANVPMIAIPGPIVRKFPKKKKKPKNS
jgi:hypothetical protein